MAFIDAFRAVNYLVGTPRFTWSLISTEGSEQVSSNGLGISTIALKDMDRDAVDLVIVSSSWTPELYGDDGMFSALRYWSRRKVTLGALDTGAFILAQAGLLQNRSATVHYEHLDAFIELYPETISSEQLCVFDGDRISCAGGNAAVDFALHIIVATVGELHANAAARYVFHQHLRPISTSQSPSSPEPLGLDAPSSVRSAIALMERHLENPLTLVELCSKVGISQRQLARLFKDYVGKSPVQYYRDIRLDRARGLVTQTALPLSQVAVASGFSNIVHFNRTYRLRFGLPPKRDRVEGRVPFEFRAWPQHRV